MAYTLDEFAGDCRAALETDAGLGGREAVRQHLMRALTDEQFVAEHIPEEADAERRILYEDPKLGFCICVHAYHGAKHGKPHDHGPTWAIYGQVAGETKMTDWSMVTPPENGQSLVHLFFLNETAKKDPGIADDSIEPRPIAGAALLGAGTMGGGIARIVASRDCSRLACRCTRARSAVRDRPRRVVRSCRGRRSGADSCR